MFVPVQVVVYSNAQVFGRRYSANYLIIHQMGEACICIYVICKINSQKRPDLVPNDLEAVSLEIRQENSQSFIT